MYRAAAEVYASQGGEAEWGGRFEWRNDRLEAHTGPTPSVAFDLLEELAREDAPAFPLSWDLTRLPFEDAKAFQHELLELVRRYGGRGGTDQPCLVQLALVPTVDQNE